MHVKRYVSLLLCALLASCGNPPEESRGRGQTSVNQAGRPKQNPMTPDRDDPGVHIPPHSQNSQPPPDAAPVTISQLPTAPNQSDAPSALLTTGKSDSALPSFEIPQAVIDRIRSVQPDWKMAAASPDFQVFNQHVHIDLKKKQVSFTGVLRIKGKADEPIELACTFDPSESPWVCNDMTPVDLKVALQKRLQATFKCLDTLECRRHVGVKLWVVIDGKPQPPILFQAEGFEIRRASSGDEEHEEFEVPRVQLDRPTQNVQAQPPSVPEPPVQPQVQAPRPPVTPAPPSVPPQPPQPVTPAPPTEVDYSIPYIPPALPPPDAEPEPLPPLAPVAPTPAAPLQPAPTPSQPPAKPTPAPPPLAPPPLAPPPLAPPPAPPPVQQAPPPVPLPPKVPAPRPQTKKEVEALLKDPNAALEMTTPMEMPNPKAGKYSVPGVENIPVPMGQGVPAQAVGAHDGGILRSANQFQASGPGFISRDHGSRDFGTQGMINLMQEAFSLVESHYPNRPPFIVGNISGKTGGKIGHASHQTGLDADIGFPSLNRATPFWSGCGGYGCPLKRVDSNFDKERFWHFLKQVACTDSRAVMAMFLNSVIKKEMCRFARDANEDLNNANSCAFRALQSLVDDQASGYPHHNHIHIRLRCPGNSDCRNKLVILPRTSGC